MFRLLKVSTETGNVSLKRLFRGQNGGENFIGKTINKHIRVDEDHWQRIEKAAHEREITPVRLMISATVEGRERSRSEAEINPLRSAMFAAQAIIRDMERAGREEEIEQISRNISEVVSELPNKSVKKLCALRNSENNDG